MDINLDNLSQEELKNLLTKIDQENQNLSKQLQIDYIKRDKKQKFVKNQQKINELFKTCEQKQILFKIAYVGINYNGFPYQQNTDNTIEQILQQAFLKSVLVQSFEDANYSRAGRTDKGVSAAGNAICVKVRSKQNGKNLNQLQILNKILPEDIKIIATAEVGEDFSARYNCKKRIYKYFFIRNNMIMQKIQEASKKFIGTHDFRNFCKIDLFSTVDFERTIFDIKLDEISLNDLSQQDERLNVFCLTITGNSFLYHQIRYMVEILFLIAKNLEQESLIDELLDIKKNPNKPTYCLADENCLLLFDCVYDGVDFQHNVENSVYTYNQLLESLMKKSVEKTLTNACWKYVSQQITSNKELISIDKLSLQKQINLEQSVKQHYRNIMSIMQKQCSVEQIAAKLQGKNKQKYEEKMTKKLKYDEKIANNQQ